MKNRYARRWVLAVVAVTNAAASDLPVGMELIPVGNAVYKGLLFETYGGNRGIYGPGGYPGMSLGVSWIPNQWYAARRSLTKSYSGLGS